MNVSKDAAEKKYYLTEGREFRTSGKFPPFLNETGDTFAILSQMIFFEKGTKVTVSKVLINEFHPDMFEGKIVGIDYTIIVSFTSVKPCQKL